MGNNLDFEMCIATNSSANSGGRNKIKLSITNRP